MIQKRNNKLIVILGSTASGKTDLTFKLAKKFNGEIVCADSRQVYKGMNIGTAKPSKTEQKAIPHHLFAISLPNKPLNAATYKKTAEKVIKDIQKRDKIPFLVGGTGLYIKAIVDNLQFPKMKPSPKLRKELEQKTIQQLFAIYEKLDKKGAKQIDKNNKRRLVRAIEVCKITGKPFWTQRQKSTPLFDVLQIGIDVPKPKLEKRIAKRVEKMFKLGLEKEVKTLVKKHGWTKILQNTIGYSEFQDTSRPPSGFGNRGHRVDSTSSHTTKKELQELIILHTIQFAKRQMTWFKKDKKIVWVDSDNLSQARKYIASFLT